MVDNNYVFVLARVDLENIPLLTYDLKVIIFNNAEDAINYMNLFPYLKTYSYEIIVIDKDRLVGRECINYNDLINNINWINEKELLEELK